LAAEICVIYDIGRIELRQTLLQVRATLARADKMPYLAAVDGTRVDI